MVDDMGLLGERLTIPGRKEKRRKKSSRSNRGSRFTLGLRAWGMLARIEYNAPLEASFEALSGARTGAIN